MVVDTEMISGCQSENLGRGQGGYIIGQQIPEVPYVVADWYAEYPGFEPEDQLVLSQPLSRGPAGKQYKELTYYQYCADQARCTLKGTDEQIRKAAAATAGRTSVKCNWFIKPGGATRRLIGVGAQGSYPGWLEGLHHQLWQRKKRIRMSNPAWSPGTSITTDATPARPTRAWYLLTWLSPAGSEPSSDNSSAPYRTITIQAGGHIITAEEPPSHRPPHLTQRHPPTLICALTDKIR